MLAADPGVGTGVVLLCGSTFTGSLVAEGCRDSCDDGCGDVVVSAGLTVPAAGSVAAGDFVVDVG